VYIVHVKKEQQILLTQLPPKLIRSVVQDALVANQPIPALIIVGFRDKVIRYYRTVDPSSPFNA
jgi:hypothetical protein